MAESDKPYDAWRQEELILRDFLAIDRTVLANERTFLAYVRTSLAFLVVGGTLFQFFDSTQSTLGACAFFGLAASFLFAGIRRYRNVKADIDAKRGSP